MHFIAVYNLLANPPSRINSLCQDRFPTFIFDGYFEAEVHSFHTWWEVLIELTRKQLPCLCTVLKGFHSIATQECITLRGFFCRVVITIQKQYHRLPSPAKSCFKSCRRSSSTLFKNGYGTNGYDPIPSFLIFEASIPILIEYSWMRYIEL